MTTSPLVLSRSALASVNPRVEVPLYDPAELSVGVVHIGVGGFHRAHMAMALDRLMNAGLAKDWAVCGVGLMESDRRLAEVFAAQDCLYTLTVKHADGRREARVIGSIAEYLFAPDDPQAVVERMADPAVRIVSLTITEGGYNFDRVTGRFDTSHPGVIADLAPDADPTTAFGFVTEALRLRRARGVAPFTVLSCDNIQGNGDMAREMFSTYAALKDPDLGEWMRSQVAFPNSMVDRITPVTAPTDVEEAAAALGVADDWPVVCEPFFQWVIEDYFSAGKPPLEQAGAQFVADVEPYELMKLRLLNASHQALCYFGYLSGYRFAHEALADPLIERLLRRYMLDEGTPTLRPVPGIDLDSYRSTLIERFSNPEVRDTLARLCAESSDRIPKWLLPVIRQQLESGGNITCSAAVVASWARYAEGIDEEGEPIEVVDSLRDELVPIARSQREHPAAFIENRALFGDLADDDRFRSAYLSALGLLHSSGARATLQAILGEHLPTR